MRLSLGVFALLCAIVLDAQVYQRDATQWFTDTGIIKEIKPISTVEGDYYLFDAGQEANVHLTTGRKILGVKINYNIEFSQLILSHEKKNYGMDLDLIQHIELADGSIYHNSSNIENLEPRLLLKRIYDSENLTFYERKIVKVEEPNYNVAMNVGSRNTRITKSTTYLTHTKSNGKFLEFKPSMKGIRSLGYEKEIKSYAKLNDLSPKNLGDLVEIIKFYDKKKFGEG
ncbi:MAG: hypothetical protein ABJG78_00645 [Cyclobacteriaceae bacterium]